LCILLANLEDLSKSTLTNESQDFEIFGSVSLLVGLLETESELDLATNIVGLALSGLQLVPGLMGVVVVLEFGVETDVSNEGFLVLLVIYGNIEFRLVANDVTATVLAWIVLEVASRNVQYGLVVP
jgi:hypothetical protein